MRCKSVCKLQEKQLSKHINYLRRQGKQAYHEWTCQQVASQDWTHSQFLLKDLQADKTWMQPCQIIDMNNQTLDMCDTESCNDAIADFRKPVYRDDVFSFEAKKAILVTLCYQVVALVMALVHNGCFYDLVDNECFERVIGML